MRRLNLTDSQAWLVFFGLKEQMEHAETMAALEFANLIAARYEWSSRDRVQHQLDEMRDCYKLRARLFPHIARMIRRPEERT